MSQSNNSTNGMIQDSNGSYTGYVGISLVEQEIKEGDYTSFNKTDLLDSVNLLRGSTANNLLDVAKHDAQIKLLNIEALVKSSSAIQEATLLLSKVVTTMNNSIVEGNKNSLHELNVNSIVNANILEWTINQVTATEAQTEAIKSQTTAIQNQELKLNGNMTANVTVDTAPLIEANNIIASGVVSQIETNNKIIEGTDSQKLVNDKLLEKLNQELSKDINFEGQTYSKTEIEKLKDLETLKNVKDENETLLNDSLELIEDSLTDGFDISFNPLDFILNQVKQSLQDETNIIKTKYNLKESEI